MRCQAAMEEKVSRLLFLGKIDAETADVLMAVTMLEAPAGPKRVQGQVPSDRPLKMPCAASPDPTSPKQPETAETQMAEPTESNPLLLSNYWRAKSAQSL